MNQILVRSIKSEVGRFSSSEMSWSLLAILGNDIPFCSKRILKLSCMFIMYSLRYLDILEVVNLKLLTIGLPFRFCSRLFPSKFFNL